MRRLTDALRTAGLTVWLDEEAVRPGQDWAAAISQAIDHSRIVLVALSEGSAKSDWVRSEAALALSKADKRVIPVLLSANADIPLLLRSRQHLDLSDKETYDLNLRRLVEALRVDESSTKEADDDARYRLAELERDALALEMKHLSQEHLAANLRVLSSTLAVALVTAGLAVLATVLFTADGRTSGVMAGILIGAAAALSIPVTFPPLTRAFGVRVRG